MYLFLNGCNDNICYKRIVQYISSAYKIDKYITYLEFTAFMLQSVRDSPSYSGI